MFDPDLRALRSQLQAECQTALTTDLQRAQARVPYVAAPRSWRRRPSLYARPRLSSPSALTACIFLQDLNIDALLWKHAFYKPIEEFRTRLSKPDSNGMHQKTLDAYLKFLQQGVTFYKALVQDLRALPQPHTENGQRAAEISRARSGLHTTISRCLICEGDLERYAATAALQGRKSTSGSASGGARHVPDLEASRRAYAAAAAAWPESGNAFNQLAVLASMAGEDFAAAYYYLR